MHRAAVAPRACAHLLFLLALALASSVAQAQFADPNLWDTNGEARAFVLDGSTLYVGGSFTRVNSVVGHFAVFDGATGNRETGWPMVTRGGSYACVPDGSGGWYFAGGRVGSIARKVAHIRADHSLDGFSPIFTGNAYGIAVGGGTIFVGGTYSTIDGQPRNGIAAFDSATGQLKTWTASPASGVITAVALQGNTLYVGGLGFAQAFDATSGALLPWSPPEFFDEVTGLIASGSAIYLSYWGHLQKLDATTGALIWDAVPGGNPVAQSITGIALSHGVLYIVGGFTSFGGPSRNGAAAVDTLTGTVSAWDPNPGTATATCVAVDGGTVYLGGSFSTVGGQPRANLAAVDTSTGTVLPWNPSPNDQVKSIKVAGGKVAIGGLFHMFGSGVTRNNLAAFDLTTGLPTSWNPNANNSVHVLVRNGSTLFAGGAFTQMGGLPRVGLAAIDLAGGTPTGWIANAGASSTVLTLALHGSRLYAGGIFSSLAGQSRSHAGAVDATTGALSAWNPSPSSFVRKLVPAGDRIYLGGEFSNLNGIPRSRLAAVDTVTGAPISWNAGTTNQAVYALTLRDTILYAGGDFTSIGGQTRNRLAALGASSALPDSWNPGAGATVLSLSSTGGTVMVAGNFSTAGGQSRTGIAEIDSATGAATAWHPPVENGFVHAFGRFANDVFIGGNFTNIGGLASHGLARLLPPDPNAPTVTAGTPANTSANELIPLTWTASDDYAVQNVDLYLSRSGPGGPWEVIAIAAAPTGSYTWKVTGPPSTGCVIRVDARDYEGNLASDVSDVFSIGNPLAVEDEIARGLQLGAPIPNPLSRSGQVWFQAPRAGTVRVTLIDLQGREVQLLADRHVEAGRHTVALRGDQVPPGLYFVRIAGFGEQRSRRVVFIR